MEQYIRIWSTQLNSAFKAHKKTEANYGFKEPRRRKRHSPSDQVKLTKKASMPTVEERDPRISSQPELATRNFFAPLRALWMDYEYKADFSATKEYPSSKRLNFFAFYQKKS
jgi:hypothetical protein